MSGVDNITVPAGFWIRFAAFIIDSFIIGTVVGVLGIALIAFESDSLSSFAFNMKVVSSEAVVASQEVDVETSQAADYKKRHDRVQTAVGLLLCFLYNVILNASRFQGTLGKHALGLKVCDANNRRIGFIRSVIRSLASYLSAIILCIGFMIAGWNKRKRSLHDYIAGTYVVVDGSK